jgi:hypothetical protein
MSVMTHDKHFFLKIQNYKLALDCFPIQKYIFTADEAILKNTDWIELMLVGGKLWVLINNSEE